MYQAGEVDYLVATDAIGMGLNMDVDHVAFAGLSKFDGHRRRRLTPGRDGADRRPRRPPPARRHVRLADAGGRRARRVPARGDRARSRSIASRRSTSSTGARASSISRSVDALIARSSAGRPRRELRAAPEAIDLAVLKRLAGDPEVARPRAVARAGAAALGGLRPARFPQDRARASCPAGRAHLHPSERGRRPHPAGLVCRAGRAARQCPGRYRHARRPDRRGAHLGLYRPPRRLARRSRRRWPSAPWRSRRSSPTRCTSG